MNKLYSINHWENYPSEKSPLNKDNLMHIEKGIDDLDNRVIKMNTEKANSDDINTLVKNWSIDEKTGVITVEKFNGEKVLFDLNIEKIPVDFELSKDGILTMTTDDGSNFTANIGAMIPVLTFDDSDTITVSVNGTGVNKTYSFSIKAGSVTEDKLQPNFLADVKTEVAKAQASQTAAADSASAASVIATLAESYTHGGTGTREGEETDNAKYYMEQAKEVVGADFVTHSEVGQPNGVAGLDESGKVPTEQLPENIGGGIPTNEKGQPNGVATLGDDGKVPAEQLPEIGEKVVVDDKTIVKDDKTGKISVADDITKSISNTQKSLLDHTDALVMSAEGVHGLRYHEDKLEAKDSEGTWHEILTGGGGGGIPLAEPTNTSLANADESVVIKWTDPDDIVVSGSTIAKWDGTVIVRKVGSAPTSKTDGVLIVDSKVKNQYATNGFTDNGLDNGTEYFYGFFPYTDKNVYTTTKVSSITPSEIYPTAPTNVTAEKGNALATVSFTLAEDASSAKIVYGTHAPTSPSDGTTIETTTSPYTIEGLVNDTTYYIVVYAFNAKGRYTASDVVEVTPKSLEIVTFADGTWEQIQAMLEAHYNDEINISDYWSVDDRKYISLSAMSATGVGESHHADTYEYVIYGIEHDDLAEPINGHTKAAITIGQLRYFTTAGATNGYRDKELGYMNSTATTSGGWESCARRKWCNEVFFNALPDGLKPMVKTVKKYSGVGNGSASGIQTTQDKVFLLSEIEIFGSRYESVDGEGNQYQFFAMATSNFYKFPTWTTTTVCGMYWERSPRMSYANRFCGVGPYGNYEGSNAAYEPIGIAPTMCL